MGIKDRLKKRSRNSPVAIVNTGGFEEIICSGYRRLSDNPEIMTAVGTIADVISSMSIHLMENTDRGDVRIKDQLSRKIDIEPNKIMTRKTFMYNVVRAMLLEGNGNAIVYPVTENGFIKELEILDPALVSIIPNGKSYYIDYMGVKLYPDEILHFPINPQPSCPYKGTGYRVQFKDIVKNLNQATQTKNAFMSSKYKPPIIVKMDSMSEEIMSVEGRDKLSSQYLETAEAGKPWIIPAELIDVQSIKPLTISDLAINESVEIDKKTAAAIIGVPSFLLGVGEFKEAEWNNFINTKIKFICEVITQEMTKKLLISPNKYWKFNIRSLYSYDIRTLSDVGCNLYTRGLAQGNEIREWMNMPPLDGLDELVILENYIPQGMIGEQNKLKGENE